MSSASGRLVVLDRSGRETRSFPLGGAALATLGSDPACDIRVLLPTVAKHHATIAVHTAQTVIRNVDGAATLVNGAPVSVAALRHGDLITLADRHLRWEYDDPTGRRQPRVASPSVRLPPSATTGGGGGGGGTSRGKRRGSDTAAMATGSAVLHRDRALQLALEMNHRASMPGSSGGKQVAIVQPQRRDTSLQIDPEPPRSSPLTKRRDRSNNGAESPPAAAAALAPHTTQATLWIESRKTSPRRAKSLQSSSVCAGVPTGVAARRSAGGAGGARARKATPLRMAVLKRAHRPSLVKIQAPLTIDYTKQAAIMLMTGHTKSKLSKSPSYVVKKPSPVRKTPPSSSRKSSRRSLGGTSRRTPRVSAPRASGTSRGSTSRTPGATGNRSTRSSGNQSVTIVEITDTESRRSDLVSTSTSSKSPHKSPALPSPKKSALKDTSKKTTRKVESIKFDLSNLENHQESDVVLLSESTKYSDSNVSDDDITLRYSESSDGRPTLSPSPRHSIHSRSSRILEKLGATRPAGGDSVDLSPSRTLTPDSRTSRKSTRGSLIVQKALDGSSLTDYTKSESRVESAFRTRTLSPRKNMESYSIVDLVSLESNDSSVYSSADSAAAGDYGTPQTSVSRRTRSTIDPTLLGSSTPYLSNRRQTRSKSNLTMDVSARSSISTRRSKSLTTPENKPVTVNSTRVSRRSRSRSRINDSDLLLLDDTEVEDSSPKTSKRARSTKSNVSNVTEQTTNIEEGTTTPENRHSPVEVGTPVLSIQSLLDSSRSSLTSQASSKRGRRPLDTKRKTIGVISERRPRGVASRATASLGGIAKKTVLRLSRGSSENSDKTDDGAPEPDNEEKVTPKSAVKLVPEAVKNKHSTAKKPVSKRSLIDDLNQSDIVKQLFNSPVKRKLSQSMTEFSRKRSFDDEEVVRVRRPTRNTVAGVGRTADVDGSVSDHDTVITPERFVSPIQTPTDTPNMSGIKRLFEKNTPKARGVISLSRTPETRRSTRNDLTNVSGVKAVFGKSPRNRLSDVRVKDVFGVPPEDDLRRVTGVKALFRENRSPKNDLTNVHGVKRLFARKSPRNDLTDVRGVRNMYQHGRGGRRGRDETADVSGIEELFHESTASSHEHDAEALFDRLVGRPVIKAVYSKTLSTKKPRRKRRTSTRSLHTSIDVITNNVEQWLEAELQKCLHRDSKVTKELQRLATETVQGGDPIRLSRTRNTSIKNSASDAYSEHSLPIKKRSLVRVSSSESNNTKNKLPIKKRAVVHSTPVKGRVNLTMNASELGRVSPIAIVDQTREHVRSTRQMPVVEEKLPSPEKVAPVPPRATRNRKVGRPTSTSTERNAKKRRNSLVITKKTPVMTPKPDPEAKSVSFGSDTKKPTRSTRAKKDKTIETPKKTHTRAQKATLVVTKPSPQIKPRRGKRTEPQLEPNQPESRKRAQRVQPESPKRAQKVQPESPKRAQKVQPESPKRAQKVQPESPKRAQRVQPESPKRAQKVQPESPKRAQRGRRAKTDPEPQSENEPIPKRTRKTTARTEPATATPEQPPKRTRRGGADLTEVKTTRQRKKVITEVTVEAVSKPKRGRPKAADSVEEVPVVKRTRGRKAGPEEGQGEGRGRSTRARGDVTGDTTANTQAKGGKRKATLPEVIPSKVSRSEVSKRKATLSKGNSDDSSANKTVRGRRKVIEVVESPVTVGRSRSTRATKVAQAAAGEPVEVGKKTRGKSAKVAEPSKKASVAPSPSPVKRTRGARAALGALRQSVAGPAPAPASTSTRAGRSCRR